VVNISPTSASVPVSQTQQFTATVTGTSNTSVTWEVNGLAGGNSTTGTVTSGGLYSAPVSVPNPATVTVTAVSQADTTKSASASVTVTSNTGTNFYVSPTGSDSNNGTSTTSAWKTIQHAMNSVSAGSTVNVMAGTYTESVTINVSGSASAGPVTLQNYSGQAAIIDGTGLTVSGQTGLININGQSYVTVQGLEIRNYSTSSTANVPIGIYITGGGSNISILNNHIHNIKTSASGCNANALGMAVYGNNGSVAISNLTVSGNELDHMTTGCSETLTLNGNVDGFSVTNNKIHDNNNIGIDAIGFEGTSPNSATDQARNGTISGNQVYNITSYGNPAYGNQYAADGIYCDGCTNVIIDSNLIYKADLNIEVASEHSGKTSSYVTVRNNLVYQGNSCGISIGGYASNVGGSDHVVILNNTLWDNDTKNTGSGEFQIQYHATNNVFKNNIVYGSSQGLLVNNYTNSTSNPVDSDYNVFNSSVGSASATFVWLGTTETGFSSYQSASGKDAHSVFADPLYVNLSSTPPNLDVQSGSPAINTGIANLPCSIGYCGSGTSIYGSTDYAGNARINSSGQINIGAYEQ
jgi:Right handed beta helix region